MVVLGEGIHDKVETDHDELCEASEYAISDDTTVCNHVLTVPARQKAVKEMPVLRRIDLLLPSGTRQKVVRVETMQVSPNMFC